MNSDSFNRVRAAVQALFALLLVVCVSDMAWAQKKDKPAPTFSDISYGPHERNVLDLWRAETKVPAPLVIFIHGGGYRAGSKEKLDPAALNELLDAGISVASVNYRYYQQAPLPAALHDCRRALQFVRSKSPEWNIDKSRVGAFGGSAGAVASMYLAFHDEMANPNSDDPVERESTRLQCVATKGGQTTLDLEWWEQNVPGWAKGEVHKDEVTSERWGIAKPDFQTVVADISALPLISAGDPAIWMSYDMSPSESVPESAAAARNWKIHHVAFGQALKQQMDRLGIESHLNFPGSTDKQYSGIPEFFRDKLKAVK